MQVFSTRSDVWARRPRWLGLLVWTLGWVCLLVLGERIDLANKALVLVLVAAVAAIWSSPWISVVASAGGVLAFNVAFVPPRGRLTVDIHQHALLLVTMLSVSWIVVLLVARLRWHAAQATKHALRSDQLRRLGDTLRIAGDLAAQAAALQDALTELGGSSSALLVAGGEGAAPGAATVRFGSTTPDEAAGLRLCLAQGRAMGPGTGRHEELAAWYLPMRGRQRINGAVLIRLVAKGDEGARELEHAQALCDQMGAAVEQTVAVQAAAAAREQASAHALRNTLLAAISHDHRTPLATILGAASALHDQGDRLSDAQRRQLTSTIIDEASQLSRLTDNTLQLARLGAVGLALQRDWESVEEMVGTVLRRVRQRHPGARLKGHVEPGLPLLRCDPVLMVQLLDNLVDNALKHGAGDAPVEVVARRMGASIVIAVRDRGPGVPAALRERVFETFHRGSPVVASDEAGPLARRGAGIGLALCRAIARAHGGEMRLRSRRQGGSSFELVLPVEPALADAAGEEGEGAHP